MAKKSVYEASPIKSTVTEAAQVEQSVAKKNPGGRPTIFNPAIIEEITARMAEGETLIAICRTPGMPATRRIREWARDDIQGFGEVFRKARELQAHAVAELVLQGARDATDANLGRLQMDSAKWFAARLLPKVYSDRVAVDAKFELEDNRSTADIAASIAARQARLMITDGK